MLTAENISKKFSGVTALDSVSLELYPGKVNAIIGENGAGKSTLMKILSGVYQEYEGNITLNGKKVRFQNTREAQEAGIAIIHQELNLVPELSITENIFLGREVTNALGFLRRDEMHSQCQQLLTRLNLNVDPDTRISKLKVGQQQVVEIAKALSTKAEVIIMDEPTSAISENEVEVLFSIIRELRNDNKTIVYISHKLDELFRIADRYVVLRDGCTVHAGDKTGMTFENLVTKMVGREIQRVKKGTSSVQTDSLLSVKNLSLSLIGDKKRFLLRDVSFQLFKGEIIGIFGLMGAGRTELLETIFGLHPERMIGEIAVDQRRVKINSPRDAIKAGLALVPEDRKKDGLVLQSSVTFNMSLTTLGSVQVAGMVSEAKESALVKKYVDKLSINTSSPNQMVGNLSGGNQQKIVLAKWLATKPKVLLLDEPTRGIDINAKNEIYKLILQLAADGLGIVMVSSELPEILAVSNRILVMADGMIAGEFDAGNASETLILAKAIPKIN